MKYTFSGKVDSSRTTASTELISGFHTEGVESGWVKSYTIVQVLQLLDYTALQHLFIFVFTCINMYMYIQQDSFYSILFSPIKKVTFW